MAAQVLMYIMYIIQGTEYRKRTSTYLFCLEQVVTAICSSWLNEEIYESSLQNA